MCGSGFRVVTGVWGIATLNPQPGTPKPMNPKPSYNFESTVKLEPESPEHLRNPDGLKKKNRSL